MVDELRPLSVPLTGTRLVEASAGTGKTHTITTLFLRLLLERELGVSQILVVTFTNAAAAELQDRIRTRLRRSVEIVGKRREPTRDHEAESLIERVGPERARRALEAALADFDEAPILTIHGFCLRMLEQHAFESGARFDARLVADEAPFVAEVVGDFWAREIASGSLADLAYLAERELGFSALCQLARKAIAHPDLPIVTGLASPPARAYPPEFPALERYLARRTEARALYFGNSDGSLHTLGSRERVHELLLESPGLHRGKYTEQRLRRGLPELDALLAEQTPTLVGWSEFMELLTPERLASGTKGSFTTPSHPFFDRMADLVQAKRDLDLELERRALGMLARLVVDVRRNAPEQKRRDGVQSYDDLLNQLLFALRSDRQGRLAKSIARDYPVALIDEFQDTDPVQYEIFHSVYQRDTGTLFLIGDPKQAIYSFRGADVFSYLEAARGAGDQRLTLLVNHRSDPSAVRATNTLFRRVSSPFALAAIDFNPCAVKPGASDRLILGGEPASGLEILYLTQGGRAETDRRSFEDLVAGHIAGFLQSGAEIDGESVHPRDIAVLTRTNLQAAEMQKALGALGIPSVLHGDSNVLDTAEARELAYVLRALAEPSNARAVRTALVTRLFGLGAAELFELGEDERAWEAWVFDFHAWHVAWKERGFVQAFRRLLAERAVPARMLRGPGGERALTNLLHLGELLEREASDRHLGISGLLEWFNEARHDCESRGALVTDAQQIRLESDAHAVTLTTVHRAKGLQYPIVYVPNLSGPARLFPAEEMFLRYHAPRSGAPAHGAGSELEAEDLELRLDVRRKADKVPELEQGKREAFAESLRLLYVGLTRARHRTFVVWGTFPDSDESALGYLLHPRPAEIGALATSTATRIKGLDDAARIRELDELARSSDGAIRLSVLDGARALPFEAAPSVPVDMTARVFTGTLDASFRALSFSALVRPHAALSLPAREGRDLDEGTAAEAPAEKPGPDLRRELPRGTRAGQMLHSILEQIDFRAAESELLRVVDENLARYGFDAERLRGAVLAVLGPALETPFAASMPGLKLRALGREQRLDELEFTLPVALESESDTEAVLRERLTVEKLLRAFREHATSNDVRDYAERVAELGFGPLSGYLRGFVDLVFEWEGRFYVVDYKSNDLGASASDYRPSLLARAMHAHHYFLQYHLYALALHRYLGSRLAHYDYERHFGGVYYLFLRGLTPDSGATLGVYADRPPLALVCALERALGGSSRRTPGPRGAPAARGGEAAS